MGGGRQKTKRKKKKKVKGAEREISNGFQEKINHRECELKLGEEKVLTNLISQLSCLCSEQTTVLESSRGPL